MEQPISFNCFQSTGLLISGALLGLIGGGALFWVQPVAHYSLSQFLVLAAYLAGGQFIGLTAVLLLMLRATARSNDC